MDLGERSFNPDSDQDSRLDGDEVSQLVKNLFHLIQMVTDF